MGDMAQGGTEGSAVQRIGTTYEVRGLLQNVTGYSEH